MFSTGSLELYFFLAYVLGSIPIGCLAARLLGKGTLFNPGERTTMNTGEVFKILGNPIGILVTALDVLKGVVVVWPLIPLNFGSDGHQIEWAISVGGFLAVIGHCNSIFLGFKGGRGLATTFGVLLILLPVPTLMAFVVWGCLSFWGLSTRPGAVSSAGAMPLFSIPYCWWIRPDKFEFLIIVGLLSLWTLWEHRKTLQIYLGLQESKAPPPPQAPIQVP